MKIVITLWAFIALGLCASPTGIFQLTDKELGPAGFSFKVERTIPSSSGISELVYISATFPTSISLSERSYEGEFAEFRFRIRKDAIDDTLISGVYDNGSFFYQADLGVILGDELELRALVELQRQQYLNELIRVIPDSSSLMRELEYLKRDRLRELLLSHRDVQSGIELIVAGTELEVVVDSSFEDVELNLSLRGLDRYRSLQFALQQINARAVVTDGSIHIERLPEMLKE